MDFNNHDDDFYDPIQFPSLTNSVSNLSNSLDLSLPLASDMSQSLDLANELPNLPQRRSRAGTLPSRLYQNSPFQTSQISFNSTTPDNRLRSGSLYSIWNDKEPSPTNLASASINLAPSNLAPSNLAPSNLAPSNLAPQLPNLANNIPQLNMAPVQGLAPLLPNRNRSYTTNQILDHSVEIRNRSSTYSNNEIVNLPTLQDIDTNFNSNITNYITSFDNPSLSPTPTLFLDNLPPTLNSLAIYKIIDNFHLHHINGGLKSIKLFNNGNTKNCLVEFENIELSMNIKANLTHYEFLPGYICYIAYIKFLDDVVALNTMTNSSTVSNPPSLSPPNTINISETGDNEILRMLLNFEISDEKTTKKVLSMYSNASKIVNKEISNNNIASDSPSVKAFDSPKLREIRKQLDLNLLSEQDMEEMAVSMLDEFPELAIDYLGNTIVQKIFENVDLPIKLMLLKRIAPYMATVGIHKNGTWAAQKMIMVTDSPAEKKIIGDSLLPYSKSLFNDQFGNYVLQCCLKFGSPFNDFIFEAIVNNFKDVSCSRFGSRAIRAILENNESTVEQITLLSCVIVMNVETLIINSNGNLLITWFLDTCQLPNRYSIISPRLLPYLFELCTHKLADLTILKVLNNRNDLISKMMILDEIFGKFGTSNLNADNLLKKIIYNVNGGNFVYKLLSSSTILDNNYKMFIIPKIKKVLIEMNGNNYSSYKKLIDEVGLRINPRRRFKKFQEQNYHQEYYDYQDFYSDPFNDNNYLIQQMDQMSLNNASNQSVIQSGNNSNVQVNLYDSQQYPQHQQQQQHQQLQQQQQQQYPIQNMNYSPQQYNNQNQFPPYPPNQMYYNVNNGW